MTLSETESGETASTEQKKEAIEQKDNARGTQSPTQGKIGQPPMRRTTATAKVNSGKLKRGLIMISPIKRSRWSLAIKIGLRIKCVVHLQIACSARDQLKLNLSIIQSSLNYAYVGYSNPKILCGIKAQTKISPQKKGIFKFLVKSDHSLKYVITNRARISLIIKEQFMVVNFLHYRSLSNNH